MEHEGRLTVSSDFANLLRRHRLAAGLSQEGLAERARMSSVAISALERGQRRRPQRETLALLIGALALDGEQRAQFEAAARSGQGRSGGSVAPGPWPETRTPILPLPVGSFVGRERELDAIVDLLRDHRLVTIAGAGGIGKTQTALRAGRQLIDDVNAVYFVDLAAAGNAPPVASSVASAIGVVEVPDRPILQSVCKYLESRTAIVILDNCEHVIADAARVAAALLAACGGVRILATSREALRIAGEHAYRLPSLSVPPSELAFTALNAASYDAVALFVERARSVDHRFTLTDKNATSIADLCRRLDGIPLAIELAAARTNSLTIDALKKRLTDRFNLLTIGARTAPARQQTMYAAIEWSYELLSLAEQRTFERLSVFAGGCALSEAMKVCADEGETESGILNLLASLVDKSMVQADLTERVPRYRLLESSREFARALLIKRGELELVLQRHATAYLELAEELDAAYERTPDSAWFADCSRELGNLRSALTWALTERGDVAFGGQLMGRLRALWAAFPVEGRRWIALARKSGKFGSSQLARMSLVEAEIAGNLGESEVELVRSEEALALFQEAGDELGVCYSLSRLGRALVYAGRVVQGEPLLRQALQTARSLGASKRVIYILQSLSNAYAVLGDYSAARECIREALAICDATGAERQAAHAAMDLAEIELLAGNAPLAFEQTINAEVGLCKLIAGEPFPLVLNLSSACLVAMNRFDDAAVYARKSLTISREGGFSLQLLYAIQRLAAISALRAECGQPGDTFVMPARLLGFLDAQFAEHRTTRYIYDQQEYERTMDVLRNTLGEKSLVDLMAAGSTMTEEEAVAEALRSADSDR